LHQRPNTNPGAPAGSMVDARDTRYEYDTAGQLRRIVDAGANQITEYAYDAMGRHVRESLTQGSTVIRDTRIGYDALGRMTKVSDPGQYTRYTFDANGNRRRGLTQYVDNGGATRMVDNWYTYDRENRITLTQGELVDLKNAQGVVTGQQIQITARQGQQLAYDTHGNRRSATGMASGSAVTEFYSFDDDNRLIGTYKNGLMASGRAYDGAGRMTDYITYTTSGAIDSRRENLYFDNGWMKQQNLYGGGGGLNQRTDYSAANAYDKVGNLLSYNVGVYVGTSYTNYYTYTYTKFDDYKEVKVAGSSTYFQPGETNTSYDVNGHISQVLDSQQQWVADGEYGYYAQQTTRTRSFIGDADGTILRKTDNGNVQNLYYAGDKAVGSVGGTAASPVADFDFNYAPVSDTYPAVSPGNYTVAAGDTLRGIAYKAYGDSKLWYLIADANGLMTDGDMHLGQALKIPNRLTNVHNDFQTNKVYNAAEIIGDITPTLPDPPPPPQASGGGGGCGGFGSILIMVVAIVAAAVIGPEVFAALAPEAGATAATLSGYLSQGAVTAAMVAPEAAAVAAGVGASVGSFAGQVVGNLAGIQDGINFGDIALSGLSAGLGSLAGTALGVSGIGNTFLREAVGGALRSTVNQGLNLLTGNQQAFNWEQVAANAIAQGVAAQAVANLPANDSVSRTLLSSITRGAVSSAFNAGGRFNFANVAADAFGNVLANSQAFASFGNASQQTEKLDQEVYEASAPELYADSRARSGTRSDAIDPRRAIGNSLTDLYLLSKEVTPTTEKYRPSDFANAQSIYSETARVLSSQKESVDADPQLRSELLQGQSFSADQRQRVALLVIATNALDVKGSGFDVSVKFGGLSADERLLFFVSASSQGLAKLPGFFSDAWTSPLPSRTEADYVLNAMLGLVAGANTGFNRGVIRMYETASTSRLIEKTSALADANISGTAATENRGATVRPTWRQSEIDVGAQLDGQAYKPQISFKDGVEVPYGTKGSVRPEYYREGASVEVKNYNLETAAGRARLERNVVGQAIQRADNLPSGTTQSLTIDVRGQNVTRAQLNQMLANIERKSGGAINRDNVIIFR
jgi:YD repeat-containing protein